MFDYDVKIMIGIHCNASSKKFTAPRESDIDKLDMILGVLLEQSRGYDLTMNGHEIAGGSIRIHSPEIQEKVFTLLGTKS